jgi:polyisoprenoid-binding protein YceI
MRAAALVLMAAVGFAAPALANPTTQDPKEVPAGTYVLDKRHASLVVKVPHLGGFSKYQMRFNGLDGAFTYDPDHWKATSLTITVDPTSVDTEESGFNKQIVGWLEPKKYPTIQFTADHVDGEDGQGKVDGNLTLHGVTKPVTLDVTFNGAGPGMLGLGTRVGFSGTTRIKRSDFGVNEARLFAGDEIDIVFEVEFVKQ